MSQITEFEGHTIPHCVRIGRSEDTGKLYDHERRLIESFRAAAKEIERILALDDYWRGAVPFELFTVLESFQTAASVAAAIGYLRLKQPAALSETWR